LLVSCCPPYSVVYPVGVQFPRPTKNESLLGNNEPFVDTGHNRIDEIAGKSQVTFVIKKGEKCNK
jgi:hypothetical protein